MYLVMIRFLITFTNSSLVAVVVVVVMYGSSSSGSGGGGGGSGSDSGGVWCVLCGSSGRRKCGELSSVLLYYITTGLYLCVLYRSPHNYHFRFSQSRSGKK